jgi:hypothetical protein
VKARNGGAHEQCKSERRWSGIAVRVGVCMARASSEGGKSVLVWEMVQRREHLQQVVAGVKVVYFGWRTP